MVVTTEQLKAVTLYGIIRREIVDGQLVSKHFFIKEEVDSFPNVIDIDERSFTLWSSMPSGPTRFLNDGEEWDVDLIYRQDPPR